MTCTFMYVYVYSTVPVLVLYFFGVLVLVLVLVVYSINLGSRTAEERGNGRKVVKVKELRSNFLLRNTVENYVRVLHVAVHVLYVVRFCST